MMAKLDFKATDFAAFSPDGCGSYTIVHVLDEWVAEYHERGCEVESVATSKLFGECIEACDRHARARGNGG